MESSIKFIKQERFAVPISCPKCGQAGSATWMEGRREAGLAGRQSTLISISNGFHRSEENSPTGGARIVCDRCDTELPD